MESLKRMRAQTPKYNLKVYPHARIFQKKPYAIGDYTPVPGWTFSELTIRYDGF